MYIAWASYGNRVAEQDTAAKTFTLESILRGIHYFRCHNYTQLIALTYTLPDFLKEHPKVLDMLN